jgi:hypothetical protein
MYSTVVSHHYFTRKKVCSFFLLSLFLRTNQKKPRVKKKYKKNRPQVGAGANRGQVKKKHLKKTQGYILGTVTTNYKEKGLNSRSQF